jgi:threonine dehydrogenase-like Zn-dependent dehydrogenase
LLARSGASEVIVVEPSQKRRQAALLMGATRALEPGAAIGDADVVFELSGRPEALSACLPYCALEGRVVVVSNYGGRTAQLALGDAFHRRRLQIVSSQVSNVPGARRPRWDHDRRFALVCALLADTALDALIEAPVPFARAPAIYEELSGDRLQIVFDYGVG